MSELAKKSTLAKTAAILAVGLGISLGLCGANAFVISTQTGREVLSEQVLIGFGLLEAAGIVVCAVGLVAAGILALVQHIFKNDSNPGDPQ